LADPTGPYSTVRAGDALLDYEAGLGWVTLEPLAPQARPEFVGIVLCSDYTDRETLLRGIHVGHLGLVRDQVTR
jgi:hypothetical protein